MLISRFNLGKKCEKGKDKKSTNVKEKRRNRKDKGIINLKDHNKCNRGKNEGKKGAWRINIHVAPGGGEAMIIRFNFGKKCEKGKDKKSTNVKEKRRNRKDKGIINLKDHNKCNRGKNEGKKGAWRINIHMAPGGGGGVK